MNRLCGLLALFFGSLLCASAVSARGSLLTWPHPTHPTPAARAEACTLDVVLVTFLNADELSSTSAYQYHDHDRPWGEVDGQLTAASYRRHDFLRMLAGGYDDGGGHPTSFFGSNVTVANNHPLPQVFGSVRAYFDSVSNGAFQLHVRMVNPSAEGTGDFPRWIELPSTKEHYAVSTTNDEFWDHAYQATLDSLSSDDAAWQTGISLPHHDSADYPFSRLLRRKVLFLYSGVVFNNRASQLHPRADRITHENPTAPDEVGYRYVMGERQGFGNHQHGVDEFAGIGMHAHEIGHLLGLWHGGGNWDDPSGNRYGNTRTNNPPNMVRGQANQLGWTLMQGGGDQGPRMDEGYNPDGFYIAYRSCPNPINPFYLRDLGWLTPDEVLGSQNNYRIAPGTTHLIDRGAVEFLLNRRTLEPFRGRYVSFYDYATEEDARQGLMIWRREFRTDPSRRDRQDQWQYPILIVADGRRYFDARDQDRQLIPADHIPEYHDMLSDPFAASDINDPRTGYTEFDQDDVSMVTGITPGDGLRQATSDINRDRNAFDLALTNIDYDSATGTIRVDIYMAPPSQPTDVMAIVRNGQMTLDWEAPSDPGPPPSYRYRQSIDGTWGWPIDVDVEEGTDVQIGRLVNGTDYVFEVWAVNPLGSSDPVSISPFVLEGPSVIEFPEVVPPESDRRTVANYTATDPENDTIAWSLAGRDAGAFSLSDGLLTFQTDPDFENPIPMDVGQTDAGRAYHVTVQARAGQQSATLDVTVTVTNADDPGAVTLSPLPPQAGVQLTATLMDQDDGVTEAEWTWQRQAPGTTTWPNLPTTSEITSGETQSSYTPQQETDVGHSLQVLVSYQDGTSTDETDEKNAHSAATAAVIGVPDALESLVAAAGDQSVELTWEAPANNGGTDITDYKYRYRSDGGMTWEPPQDEDEDKEGTSLGLTTSHPVGSLTNGETYVFEVWAVNAQGDGPALTAEVTLNSAPMISGFESVSFDENGTGTVAAYTATDEEGDAIEWSLSGRDAGAFTFTPDYIDPNTIALSFQSAPDYEHPV